MMRGYDKEEAMAFIVPHINVKEHPELADRIPELISQAIDADMRYMEENDVIDKNGEAGDCYYEDDDAIEFMTDELIEKNDFTPEQAVKVVALLDDYMDLQEQYLESKGLVDWE